MSECHRCGRDTDRQTLDGDPLCSVCAEWRENHCKSRDVEQYGLENWNKAESRTE